MCFSYLTGHNLEYSLLRAWMAYALWYKQCSRKTNWFLCSTPKWLISCFSHIEVKVYMLNKYTSFCLGLLKMPCTTVNKGLYCGWAAGLKLKLCKMYFLKMWQHVLNTPVKRCIYASVTWSWNGLFQLVNQNNTPCKSVVDFWGVSCLWGVFFVVVCFFF